LEAIGDYLSSTLWRRDLVRRIESDKETFRLMDEQRHQLLEKLPSGVGVYYVYDDGRIECAYLNDGYYALLGTTREKRSRFAAFAALEAVDPGDRQALRDEALAAIRENRQLNLDIRLLSEGGGWHWMNVRANVAEREEGRCKLYCAYSDIDALKLARLQLEAESKKSRESELLIDNILRNLPGAVASFLIAEGDVRMTYISEGCETLTGFSAAETLKRCEGDAFAFVHPDDLPELRRAARENARLMKPFSHVFRVRVKGGGSRWVSLSLSPARKDGSLVYYGVYLDVDAEREHSVMISELINAIPGGVAIYRVGERIETLYASDGVAKLTGRTPEEHARWLKDDPLSSAVYEADLPRVRQSIDDALAQDRPLTLTYRLCHKDGSLVWVQFSAVKIRETSRGKIYYGVYSRPSTEASLYQSLVEDSTTAVLVMEQETRAVLFANAAWKRLENVPDSTPVIGVPLPRLLPAHHFFFSDDEVRAFPTDRYEESHRMTGTGKAVSIHARALRWNGIAAYVCYISDETELWSSHQQLQHLIDRVPGGIGIYDVQDGMPRPSYINDAYYRLLGYADGERELYPEAGTLDVVHEEDRPRLLRGVRALTDGSTALLDLSYRVRARAGEWRWLRVVGAVMERRDNHVVAYCSFSEFDSVMRSRQELESSRAMLNAALQSARVLAWKYDCRARRITDSGSLGEALGLPRAVDDAAECFIRSGYICEESAADFRALFEEAAREKPASRDVRTRPRPGGEPAWNRVIYTPVFNLKGEYVESIGTAIDITEQKERERKYEEQLGMKKVLASNESAVALLNLTRNLVADSDCRDPRMAACLRGDSVDQALAAVSGEVVYPGERAAYLAVFSRASMLENYRRGDMHGSIRHHALDSGAWLESSYDLIENPYTGDVEAIAVLRDVTELVRAEQVVSTLMKIDYETIMTIDASTGEASPFLGGRTDEATRRQQSAGGSLLGVEAYLRAHGSGPELERAVRETSLPYVKERLTRAPLYAAACTLTQQGKPLRKRIVYTYLDETEKTLLCAAQDLTETYRQEEEQKRQLAQALAEAEKASSAKTDFFSRMSHDMRTPMNGILGLATLCESEADLDELRRSMGNIRQSGQYLLSLINDTLDFQRIESGRMELEPQVVNARALMADIRDMVELTLREKRLHVSIDSQSADMDCFIRVDPVRIKQVFFNLLSNAIKFTPEDGSIAFSLECLGHDGLIAHDRIRISDTGIGMSEDFLQNHIFRPFSQEYTAVTTQYAGTGLGLSIVHKLVELMGGSISVESAPGKGTAFTILLDFERVPDEEALAGARTDEQRRHLSREALMGRRVLLVEDHPLNAEIARRILQKVGCEIDWAHNGQEGVQRFEASPPGLYDAVLMDIRMPVMNGLEAAHALRALSRPDARSLPIIAMTANAYAADVKQSLDAGMNAHLAKPIDPALLYDTLARLIAHPPAQ
ncbi:MAG: PAS domain-containing protein, partial [Eubacteriales bacterium]|nr:PAS domain-containing protein [Eubacteriales bacterium]